MTANPALEYLHTHWALPDQPPPPPPGPAWRRLAWRVAGRLTFGSLERYLAEERELLSRTVQMADALSRRVDTLENEIEQLVAALHVQLAELSATLPGSVAADDASTTDGADGQTNTDVQANTDGQTNTDDQAGTAGLPSGT